MDELAGWAHAARHGDQVAVAELVRATQRDVLRLCTHLVDRQAAEDLTQETYVRALAALPGYRAEAPFRPWLLAVARRTCADALRRRTRRRRLLSRLTLSAQPHVDDPSVHVDSAALLDGLSRERREAFVLTQLLGLTYDEAAQVAEVPVGTIRSRVARARDDLGRAWQEHTG